MSCYLKVLICAIVALAIWFFPVPDGLTPLTWHILAIFITTVVAFILQPLPVGAIALIAISFIMLTGMMKTSEALKGFSSTTVWLIVAAFLYAKGFIKTGLGRRIAYLLIRGFGGSSLRLGYTLALSDMIIAPATPSNTARAGGILFPIVRSVSNSFGSEPDQGPRKIGAYLMQTVFHSNCLSSSMFMTASAPNALIVSLAASTLFVDILWGMWTLSALVPGIIAFITMPLVIYKLYPPEIKKTPEAKALAQEELIKMGPVTRDERVTIGIFLLSLLAWSTSKWTGLDATAVALSGVCLMLMTRIITWQDVQSEKGAWDILVWLGVMICMADKLNQLGLFKWFAVTTSALFTGIPWEITLTVLLIVYCYSHYFFAGSTPHVVAMYAAFGSVSVAAGAPPMMAALSLAFVTNLMSGISHYGNGPAVIYYGAGYVSQREWWRLGFIVMLLNIAIWFGLGAVWWKILGLW
ncbi:anion permease [Escherichia coli]|nr:anion permease [Escherichia coli]